MRALQCAAALVAGLVIWCAEASASIVVRVDKTSQTMRVIVDGEHRHTWAVSTGRAGYNTPNGSYRPQRLERHWRSRKYGMAPMPHSIFFRGGYAIHGTNMVGRLGRVDSHGCIRLSPGNARTLYEMVARRRGATRIVIEGVSPRQTPPALVAGRNARMAAAAPPRTQQMRLVEPQRPSAAVVPGLWPPAWSITDLAAPARTAATTPAEPRIAARPAAQARHAALPAAQRAIAPVPGHPRAARGGAGQARLATPPAGHTRVTAPGTAHPRVAANARGEARVAAPGSWQARSASAASSRTAAAPGSRDDNRHFMEWYLRR